MAPVVNEVTDESVTTEVLEDEMFYYTLSEELAELTSEELMEYYQNDFTQEDFDKLREEFKDYIPESNALAASSRGCNVQDVGSACWQVTDCASGKRYWVQQKITCDHLPGPIWTWSRRSCCSGGSGPN